MSAKGQFAVVAVIVTVPALTGCGSSSKPHSTGTASTTGTTGATSGSSGFGAPVQGAEISPGVIRATSGDLVATMHASTHTPTVNHPWPVAFSVQRAGAPAAAVVSYQYLFAGQVVARRDHYRFQGHFADVFHWPSSAVGYQLTFRAVIESGGGTVYLDYPVRVRE